MKSAGIKTGFGWIQGLLMSALVSGCTGVLNDPSVKKANSDIALDDDTTNQYLWNQIDEIKGNKYELTITGTCGTQLKTISVTAESLDSTKVSFEVPCTNGILTAPFLGTSAFTKNGLYKLTFSGTTSDINQKTSSVSKVYNLYKVADPSQMVAMKCMDSVGSTQIPFVNLDECTVTKTQNLRLDGLCTTEATEHQTTVTIKDVAKSCSTFSEDFASLTTGAHLLPVTWIDPWGNTYTLNILAKKLDVIDWQGGSVSFVASGKIQSSVNSQVYIEAAVGTPFVPFDVADVSNAIPFARAPASYVGSPATDPAQNVRIAPGFLSLIYGLTDGS